MNDNKAFLCKTRKEKLNSSKRLVNITHLSYFGNLFQLQAEHLEALFFSLKHFFFWKKKTFGFLAQWNMHEYNLETTFVFSNVVWISSIFVQ